MATQKLAKKLTPIAVEMARPEVEPYRVWDTVVPQLHVRVQPSGIKSWNVQWSRTRSKSLGKWPGVTVEAARQRARILLAETQEHGAPLDMGGGPATVSAICRDYADALEAEGRKRAALDARKVLDRIVHGDPIGKIRADRLTQKDLEAWQARMAAGELSGRKKCKPSPATLNRNLTTLKAALNRALSRREIPQARAIEWSSIKRHKGADQRREVYLDRSQRAAFLGAADGDLRDLLTCVALTGCRPGDPAALLRKDYDSRTASVTFRTKTGPRTIPISPATKVLFDRLAKNKLPAARMFTNDKEPWTAQAWAYLVKKAVAKAGLPADTVVYALRHSWITDAIVGGMDVVTAARLTGTSVEMINKNYGHLVQGAARDKLATVNFL